MKTNLSTEPNLEKAGYKYFPDYSAWVKPSYDENGKEKFIFIPGFRDVTITDKDIYEATHSK